MKTAITCGFSGERGMALIVDEHPREIADALQSAFEAGDVYVVLTHTESGQPLYVNVDAPISWNVVERVEFQPVFPEDDD